MRTGPGVRKLALTAHVTASVGWLGAVVAFLGLAVVAVASSDVRTVRAVYVAAEPLTWYVVVPFGVASLVTGLVSALGTTWGLFRHYWVLFKLVINILATAILLTYTQTVGYLADIAADPGSDIGVLRTPTFLIHSTLALLALLAATLLAVYKPRGLTPYGQRRQRTARNERRRVAAL